MAKSHEIDTASYLPSQVPAAAIATVDAFYETRRRRGSITPIRSVLLP
jgi:hypothetical protein